MPKKFAGENSKAVAARARKSAAKDHEILKKQQQLNDALWKDDDKHVLRKQERKKEQERKKQELVDRKAENKALLEKETIITTKTNNKVVAPPKITRAQISTTLSSVNKPEKEKKLETHLEKPLDENINRLVVDGDEARSVTEAIAVLSLKPGEVDKHPEKRLKAAYTAYEERELKIYKEQNPSLRLSQLKQMIFKEWQKSPENPLNS